MVGGAPLAVSPRMLVLVPAEGKKGELAGACRGVCGGSCCCPGPAADDDDDGGGLMSESKSALNACELGDENVGGFCCAPVLLDGVAAEAEAGLGA